MHESVWVQLTDPFIHHAPQWYGSLCFNLHRPAFVHTSSHKASARSTLVCTYPWKCNVIISRKDVLTPNNNINGWRWLSVLWCITPDGKRRYVLPGYNLLEHSSASFHVLAFTLEVKYNRSNLLCVRCEHTIKDHSGVARHTPCSFLCCSCPLLLCHFLSPSLLSHVSHYLPRCLEMVSLPLWIVFISLINLWGPPKYSTEFLMRHTQACTHTETHLGAVV